MADHSSEVNCEPLSEVIEQGTPNLATQLWINARATVFVSMFLIGMASGHRVKRSTMVRRYVYSWDSGRGPTKST